MKRPIRSTVSRPRVATLLIAGTALLTAGGTTTAVAVEALAATPAGATAMAPVTVSGKVVAIVSTAKDSSSFRIKVGSKTDLVKCDAMTHITENGMKVTMSKLAVGDTVRVRGPLEMGTISASSVVITTM